MKYLTMHWSAGSHKFGGSEKKHYHFAVDGNGQVHAGQFKPEDNEHCTQGTYAAHTGKANTGNIGVALCAMAGAKENPFNPGKYPIKEDQLQAFIELVADLAISHGIPCTRQNILTHAEWEPTNGVKQRGKWDITWIPGMDKPGGPVQVGDVLRARIERAMHPPAPVKTTKTGLIDLIVRLFKAILGRKS